MTVAFGFETRAAFKKATTWNTAVAVGALNGFFIHGEGIASNLPLVIDDSFTGNALREKGASGEVRYEGTIDCYGRYEGLDVLLSMLMGIAGAPTQNGATTAYYNNYKPKDDLTGIFGTLVLNKQVDTWEYNSVKVNSLRISGNAGGRILLQFGLIACKLSFSPTSPVTNTVASFNSGVTEPANINQMVLFEHGAVRMNAQSAAALAAGDALDVSAFEININNNLTGDITATNDPYIDEPQRDNRLEVSGSITLPRYESSANITNFLNKTLMKMDIKCSNGDAGGGNAYKFEILLPQLQLTSEGAKAGGPGRIPLTFDFVCNRASAVVNGFDSTQRDPWLYVQNQRTTDPLA